VLPRSLVLPTSLLPTSASGYRTGTLHLSVSSRVGASEDSGLRVFPRISTLSLAMIKDKVHDSPEVILLQLDQREKLANHIASYDNLGSGKQQSW